MRTAGRTVHMRGVAVSVAVLSALLLSGCVTSEGGALGELRREAVRAESAVATMTDAFSQFRHHRTLPTVADATADNMLDEIETAQKHVFALDTETTAEAHRRTATLSEIADGAEAITQAQDCIAGATSPSATTVSARLAAGRDALADRVDALEPQ